MPKRVNYLVCDEHGDKPGKLELIAKTQDASRPDGLIREDRNDYITFPITPFHDCSLFYECVECGTIYVAHVSTPYDEPDPDFIQVDLLKKYDGELTSDQIKNLVPTFQGIFNEEAE